MAAVLGIVSAVVGAVGAIAQGSAAAADKRAQADASEYNAKVKEIQAVQVQDTTAAKVSNDSVKTRQKMAAVRAGSIQNGFETTGSIGDILRTVEVDGELEGLTSLYEGTVRAQGLRQGKVLDQMNADNARRGASNAMTAGFIGAGTTLLSGASKAYTGGNSFSFS